MDSQLAESISNIRVYLEDITEAMNALEPVLESTMEYGQGAAESSIQSMKQLARELEEEMESLLERIDMMKRVRKAKRRLSELETFVAGATGGAATNQAGEEMRNLRSFLESES